MSDLFLERDAVISDCGKYRYLLRRTWDHGKPRALIIMLNPSTADAEVDDPTIRSCARLTRELGYGSFEVINLFGLRAPDPAELEKSVDPIGARNADVGDAAINRCDIVICAWGAHPMARPRGDTMISWVKGWKPAAYCFGITKNGAPKHPLYVKSGTQLQVYNR
jgi:hypothetical protein